jgi:hypothetical protein
MAFRTNISTGFIVEKDLLFSTVVTGIVTTISRSLTVSGKNCSDVSFRGKE